MADISEILDFSFFHIGNFDLNVGTILELIAVVLLSKFALRFLNRTLKKLVGRTEWLDEERGNTIIRAGKYAIYGVAALTIFYALGLKKLIDDIYDFSLFNIGSKARLTVGSIISLVIIYFVVRFLANLLQLFIKRNLARQGWADEGREYTIIKMSRYVIYIVAFVIAIETLGININVLLGGAAALLVGVGLGLQSLFNDIVSGLILLFEGSLRVGDVIEIQHELVAKVQQIDIRTSKLITRDGNYIIVPNSKLTSDNIVNWSHGSKMTRFKISVGVAYGSNTQLVKKLLIGCVQKHPDVSKNREIIVRFEDFGDSALLFDVFFWARKTWMVETLKSEIRFEIDRVFRENKIQIPFPQRDLHVVSDLPGGFGKTPNKEAPDEE